MAKPALRTKSIGTKVTDEEYAQLEAQAGGRPISEWVREVLLLTLDPDPVSERAQTMLAEYLALRVILLNVPYRMANVQGISQGTGASHSFIARFNQLLVKGESVSNAMLDEHRPPWMSCPSVGRDFGQALQVSLGQAG